MAVIELRDEFLTEDDPDLRSLTEEDLDAAWTAWLLRTSLKTCFVTRSSEKTVVKAGGGKGSEAS